MRAERLWNSTVRSQYSVQIDLRCGLCNVIAMLDFQMLHNYSASSEKIGYWNGLSKHPIFILHCPFLKHSQMNAVDIFSGNKIQREDNFPIEYNRCK